MSLAANRDWACYRHCSDCHFVVVIFLKSETVATDRETASNAATQWPQQHRMNRYRNARRADVVLFILFPTQSPRTDTRFRLGLFCRLIKHFNGH